MAATTSGGVSSRYEAAVAALERARRFGMNPSLSGIQALTAALGRPEDSFRAVQVTGTNGKTSVTRMIAALLEAHGEPSGAYTSPHLVEYAERVEIGGMPVAPGEFAAAAEAAMGAAERVAPAGKAEAAFTEFELLTAAALWLMRERAVRWGVLEVGMGGRWDATSVVQPTVAVVTGVALDHTLHLGETVAAIAEDKAHVIKADSTAVLGPGTEDVDGIFARRAAEQGARVVRVREMRPGGAECEAEREADGGVADAPPRPDDTVTYEVSERPADPGGETVMRVCGAHAEYGFAMRVPAYQAANAAVAVAAAEAATGRALDGDRVAAILAGLMLPGRFQVLRRDPWVIADGAHNPSGAATLASALDDAFPGCPPTAVLAVLADKDAAGIVQALAGHVARFVVTASASPRALAAADLAGAVREVTGDNAQTAPSVAEAIETARRDGDVVVTGSLTTAGEAIVWARGRED